MIICDPRAAPRTAWFMGWRMLAFRYWFALLRSPIMGPWTYKPWGGWAEFWKSRPWS